MNKRIPSDIQWDDEKLCQFCSEGSNSVLWFCCSDIQRELSPTTTLSCQGDCVNIGRPDLCTQHLHCSDPALASRRPTFIVWLHVSVYLNIYICLTYFDGHLPNLAGAERTHTYVFAMYVIFGRRCEGVEY